MPAINIRTTRANDYNGAFFVRGAMANGEGGPTAVIDNHFVPRPDHMFVRVNGQLRPLPDANRVLVFSAHGGSFGFEGASNTEAAALTVSQIVAARKDGQAIDYVVLDACNQRDARMFFGGSNAEAFQRSINQQLKIAGEAPIHVLAADKPGSLIGVSQRNSEWSFDDKQSPANYVPADEGSRVGVRPAHVAVGALLAAEVGGTIIYRELTSENEKRKCRMIADDIRNDAHQKLSTGARGIGIGVVATIALFGTFISGSEVLQFIGRIFGIGIVAGMYGLVRVAQGGVMLATGMRIELEGKHSLSTKEQLASLVFAATWVLGIVGSVALGLRIFGS